MAIKFKDLKKGEVLSETQFYKVKEVNKDFTTLTTDSSPDV